MYSRTALEWFVPLDGDTYTSEEKLRVFDTQKEAVAFARSLLGADVPRASVCFRRANARSQQFYKVALNQFVYRDKWCEFEDALRSHDWAYAFSDDSGKYYQGSSQAANIRRLHKVCRELDEVRANKLYAQYEWHP